jgi:catalase
MSDDAAPDAAGLAARMIDAVHGVYGAHPGHRALHAKGTLCAGTFVADPAASRLSRAAHLQGDPVEVRVRFSNGTGDPGAADGARDGRGMATKFMLAGGGTTDLVAISRETFFVRTPEDFLELLTARKPDPETGQPDFARIGAFLEAHPESVGPIQTQLAAEPAASYLQTPFHAVHAFGLEAADGTTTWAKYHWVPEAGVVTLTDEEAQARDPDFLQADLAERLEAGPAAFRLELEVAQDGDPLDDPTVTWGDRPRVPAGRLELTAIATDRERDGDVLVFDPTRVVDGIRCSDDPILHARTYAYSESVRQRAGVGREAMP